MSTQRKLSHPEDAKQWLARRYENQHKQWLAGEGSWPLSVTLGLPVEADVAREYTAVRGWADAWHAYAGVGRVAWEDRRWTRLGQQRLPVRLEFASAAEVAEAIGEGRRWRRALERTERLGALWPELAGTPALVRHFSVLADYADAEFERLVGLVGWLHRNPDSGYYLRQVPVEGVDTKWLESRTSVVAGLLGAIRGVTGDPDFHALSGLLRAPWRLRLRVLCPRLRSSLGGLHDIEVPLAELKRLSICPRQALIVENLETGIALSDMPDTVALMKLGHAVGVVAELPWLRTASVVYWGDIDTHGFVCLERARRAVPHLRSALMDEATLLGHRLLWGQEKTQHPVALLPGLDDGERAVFEGLRQQRWGHNIRLEQERVLLSKASERLAKTFAGG